MAMPAPLFTHLDGRFPIYAHDHVAVLYRGEREGYRLTSFLAEGLKRGDLCQYLAPGEMHPGMLASIRALQVNPDPFLHSEMLRLSTGAPGFTELCDRTQKTFDDAERAKVPALRWLEEGSWGESAGFPAEKFFEFHALLNYQVKHYPSVALCQYSLDRLDPDFLFPAIATHRHLLIGNTLVRDNPFYIPAEKFIPLSPVDRQRSLVDLFREVGFDVEKLLAAISDYGRIHPGAADSI
ncbi:MAG TPA: MEDS domain-containing protein [Terriglobia bacterium]|nr:MEDS domain-containing protein [Terriglobia bacterium]